MKRLSEKEKLENYIRRKREQKEQDRLENSGDYQPQIEGYLPDRH